MTIFIEILGKMIAWVMDNWQGILVATIIAAVVFFITVKIKDGQIANRDNIIAEQKIEIGYLTLEVSNLSNRIIVEDAFKDVEHSIDSITNEQELSEEIKNATDEILDSYLNILHGAS